LLPLPGKRPNMKMRFTLATLLSAFVLVALSLAVFGPFGVIVGPFLVAIVVYVRDAKWRSRGWNVALVLICLSTLLVFPAIPGAREPALGVQCRNNLKHIGLALYNYPDCCGTLPPVRECDSAGRPLHSWRILLLPYLEEGSVFQQYNHSEPWNGPNNDKLTNKVPQVYQCPNDWFDGQQGTTNYVAVVGSNGAWLGPPPNKEDERNPVWVVETSNLGITWTEPQDISLEDLCKGASNSSASGLSSKHVIEGGFFYHDQPAGTNAVFADGSVRRIPPGVPAEVLRAAFLGDRQKQAELKGYARAASKVNWSNCASLAGLVVWFVLMLAWPRSTRDEGGPPDSAPLPATPGAERA
jgi:hypothetical protein